MTEIRPVLLALLVCLGSAACAARVEQLPGITVTLWEGTGYLSPGAPGESLGRFDTEQECREVVDAWKSQQVVGNPVSGECIAVNAER